jgi:hypothetical protein
MIMHPFEHVHLLSIKAVSERRKGSENGALSLVDSNDVLLTAPNLRCHLVPIPDTCISSSRNLHI